MNTGTVISKLAQEYPLSMAMSWDNPGLQVGRMNRPVKKVYVALDATEEVIQECVEWGAQLLVTHHPLLMSGVKSVSENNLNGRKALTLAENGIAHYAMHTNYDVTEMNRLAKIAMQMEQTEVLEVTGVSESGEAYGIGFTGALPTAMTAKECCQMVKNAFNLETVRLFGNPEQEVTRIALSAGSGKSMIGPALRAGVDILITGDIGHHDGLDAVDQGLMIIDAGHYGIEHIFIRQMKEYLEEQFPELEVRAAEIVHPFHVL